MRRARLQPTGAAGSSIYSSMVQVPAASSLYASQVAAPSIYSSMPVAPMVGGHAPEPKAASSDFPALAEGFSTVGLMLWPGKNGELLVTGFMEGHSAENCGLEAGDVVIAVDDNSVEGMSAADAAARMAGPTGSSVTVTTSRSPDDDPAAKTTHTAVIVRDVSSGEANKKTQESLESVRHCA
jgi:S1-C subfamily serine protease